MIPSWPKSAELCTPVQGPVQDSATGVHVQEFGFRASFEPCTPILSLALQFWALHSGFEHCFLVPSLSRSRVQNFGSGVHVQECPVFLCWRPVLQFTILLTHKGTRSLLGSDPVFRQTRNNAQLVFSFRVPEQHWRAVQNITSFGPISGRTNCAHECWRF